MQTDVLIIGGGLAGLSCAYALRDSGLRTTVVERDEATGGRARSWADSATGDVVDIGPHIFTSEYRNLFGILDQLGTRNRLVWQKDKLITLLTAGQKTVMRVHRLPPPLHLLPSLLAARPVTLRDKASNSRATWLAMQIGENDVTELDRLSAIELLRRLRVSQRFIDWFWKSVSMTIMNAPLEECSAGALLRLYSQLAGHNGYQIGFAGCGLSELHLPALEAIRRAGGSIITNARVVALNANMSNCSGATLDDGTTIEARFCVCALPPAELVGIAPPALAQHESFANARRFAPSPYISVYLWFDQRLTEEQLWTRTWSPDTLNYDFYDLSNIRAGWRERNSVIATNVIYSSRVGDASDATIIEKTVAELCEFAPAARQAKLNHARVHRIPMAIPTPKPGTERLRPNTKTGVKGLFLAGDWTNTGIPSSMESAACSGLRAAEGIWQALGRPRKLAQPLQPTEGISGFVRRLAQARGQGAARCS